jgi:hypothetical protein
MLMKMMNDRTATTTMLPLSSSSSSSSSSLNHNEKIDTTVLSSDVSSSSNVASPPHHGRKEELKKMAMKLKKAPATSLDDTASCIINKKSPPSVHDVVEAASLAAASTPSTSHTTTSRSACPTVDGTVASVSLDAGGRPKAFQFPWKLHKVLEDCHELGLTNIMSWKENGKSFQIHSKRLFEDRIMAKYFDTTRFKSFQRSLNLWGFYVRKPNDTSGHDTASMDVDSTSSKDNTIPNQEKSGECYHPYFVRGNPDLCNRMKRIKKKTSKTRRPSSKKITAVKSTSTTTSDAVNGKVTTCGAPTTNPISPLDLLGTVASASAASASPSLASSPQLPTTTTATTTSALLDQLLMKTISPSSNYNPRPTATNNFVEALLYGGIGGHHLNHQASSALLLPTSSNNQLDDVFTYALARSLGGGGSGSATNFPSSFLLDVLLAQQQQQQQQQQRSHHLQGDELIKTRLMIESLVSCQLGGAVAGWQNQQN